MTDERPKVSSTKPEGVLRTIGEAAGELGVKTHILRYWEEQFPTLSPLKRAGGRRYYRAEDMALLRSIERMVNQEGFTIAGAKKALASQSGTPLASGSGAMSREVENALYEIRTRLQRAQRLLED